MKSVTNEDSKKILHCHVCKAVFRHNQIDTMITPDKTDYSYLLQSMPIPRQLKVLPHLNITFKLRKLGNILQFAKE